METNHSALPKLALSVEEFCRSASIGRTTFYAEVNAGRITPKKVGAKTLIPVTELNDWLARLPNAGDQQ
jgi:excisionase family DNA binding protein